jgi:glycosyltransferase involved in cell wall biosynthesis
VLITGFCAVPGPRRAGVQLRHVIRALTPLHSVDLLVLREGDQGYVERQGSVRVLRVPTHDAELGAQIQSFQRALKRQLDGADYDVVHCRDAWAAKAVLEARARLGFKVVYDLTRSPLGETTFDADLDAAYAHDEDACIALADLVLAPTAAAVKALRERVGARPERIALSPPGVDVDRFDWEDPPKGAPPKIVYAGSIDAGRGVRVLVRAMAAIRREVPDARLVLAGGAAPKFESVLVDGIRDHGLAPYVERLGAVDHDEIPALLATAAVCVVPAAADFTPSAVATFPTKLLEYMACKRAIVAPNRETVATVVDNAREALLFEAGDPIDLARKVLRLLGEPALRERIAAGAYERVRRDFTASGARRAVRQAYERLDLGLTAAPEEADESPKQDLLADDDFEATVFEEPERLGARADTAISVDLPSGEVVSEAVEGDSALDVQPAPPAPRTDEWIISDVGAVAAKLPAANDNEEDDEDGTPAEGSPAAPAVPMMESGFVAGEIDVPTPPTGRKRAEREREREHDTPAVEFTAASAILGSPDSDPDTGSRTPPLERS